MEKSSCKIICGAPTTLAVKEGLMMMMMMIRLIRDGGKWGDGYICPTTYSLHSHHQNDSAFKAGSCVKHFNVSLIVWAKSQDSVQKPQVLKSKESRNGSNRGPSACHHSALPLGHTGSRLKDTIARLVGPVGQVVPCASNSAPKTGTNKRKNAAYSNPCRLSYTARPYSKSNRVTTGGCCRSSK